MKTPTSGLMSLLGRWARDAAGAAMVEFALILPLVATLYLGGFGVFQAAAVYRKLADTTDELANVAAQYTAMTTTDTSSVMAASAQIMSPFPTSNLSIVMSEIQTDANGSGTVTWSQTYPGGQDTLKGKPWVLPTSLATPNTAYILVQTTYQFTPSLGSQFIGPSIPMSDQLYMSPRQIASIPCATC